MIDGLPYGNHWLALADHPVYFAENSAVEFSVGSSGTVTCPAAQPDPMAQLTQANPLLDQGLINAQDYEAVKKKALGL